MNLGLKCGMPWRARRLAAGTAQRLELEREPMFCVETALKLMFWAGMVYEYRDGVAEAAEAVGKKGKQVRPEVGACASRFNKVYHQFCGHACKEVEKESS